MGLELGVEIPYDYCQITEQTDILFHAYIRWF